MGYQSSGVSSLRGEVLVGQRVRLIGGRGDRVAAVTALLTFVVALEEEVAFHACFQICLEGEKDHPRLPVQIWLSHQNHMLLKTVQRCSKSFHDGA